MPRSRGEEAALPRRDGREVPLAVASQPQPVAGIRPRRIRLGVVQIARHDQIEMTVAVDVVDDDPLDRRDLREVGSGDAVNVPFPSLCRYTLANVSAS